MTELIVIKKEHAIFQTCSSGSSDMEEKNLHLKANKILKDYYPKALQRLNTVCTDFMRSACRELDNFE